MKTIFRILSILILAVFISNCGNKNSYDALPNAEEIIIQSLNAVDISENLTSIATQNDEVFFMVSFIQENNKTYSIKDEVIFPELLFDSLNVRHEFKEKYDIENIDYIIFSMVELDDYDSHEKTEKTLKEELILNGDFLNKIDKIKMDSIFSNDDFLGLKYLPKNKIKKNTSIELKIKGSHLFDKYEYTIEVLGI